MMDGESGVKSLMPQRGSRKNNMMSIINEGAKVANEKKRIERKKSMMIDREAQDFMSGFTPSRFNENQNDDIITPKKQIELKDINPNLNASVESSFSNDHIDTEEDKTNV